MPSTTLGRARELVLVVAGQRSDHFEARGRRARRCCAPATIAEVAHADQQDAVAHPLRHRAERPPLEQEEREEDRRGVEQCVLASARAGRRSRTRAPRRSRSPATSRSEIARQSGAADRDEVVCAGRLQHQERADTRGPRSRSERRVRDRAIGPVARGERSHEEAAKSSAITSAMRTPNGLRAYEARWCSSTRRIEVIRTPGSARTAIGGPTRSGGSSGVPMRGHRRKANGSLSVGPRAQRVFQRARGSGQVSGEDCPIIRGGWTATISG